MVVGGKVRDPLAVYDVGKSVGRSERRPRDGVRPPELATFKALKNSLWLMPHRYMTCLRMASTTSIIRYLLMACPTALVVLKVLLATREKPSGCMLWRSMNPNRRPLPTSAWVLGLYRVGTAAPVGGTSACSEMGMLLPIVKTLPVLGDAVG